MIQKIVLLLINLIFGSMVLLSYYCGVNRLKDAGQDPALLWGGVPDVLQPIIVTFMFLGAVGYFFFTYIYYIVGSSNHAWCSCTNLKKIFSNW